ncbi:TPA: hypothetical protein QDC22_007517 [Burkholderia stabilis]|nr:hypothetical protein [Burkholderia stabilis]HDR9589128.1 hypothetical protein [Burkholderia stabilis]HDR9649524.1 hypothetical protein [Burkholderia stabilis]HDR9653590.1 hypothetical protein [Burkholderia stabilis]HDR9656285.1 hypothetical protein [Burkholderia stabilis]
MRFDRHNLSEHDIEPLVKLFDVTFPDALREIAASLFAALLEQTQLVDDVGRHGLAELAIMQTERLSSDLGGHSFYMHKGASYRLTPRNRQMCAEFRGDNYAELADRYGLTEMRVRQIVDGWRREQFLARQGTLDLPSE